MCLKTFLTDTKDYKIIAERGRQLMSSFFVMKYCDKNRLTAKASKITDDSLIIGLTISKKLGNAVKRNLLKRRLKFIFRNLEVPLKLRNKAINLYLRKLASDASFLSLKKELDNLFRRI